MHMANESLSVPVATGTLGNGGCWFDYIVNFGRLGFKT